MAWVAGVGVTELLLHVLDRVHGGLALASDSIRDTTGLVLHPWRIPSTEMIALATMAACGVAATLIPAISCYRRTPIADLHLTD